MSDVLLVNAATCVATLVVLPFQAGTLSVAALNQEYPTHRGLPSYAIPEDGPVRPLDNRGIAGRLTAADPTRRTWWAMPLLVTLPLPGLLFGWFLAANPSGLPVDRVRDDGAERVSASLEILSGERPIEVFNHVMTTRVCADAECRDSEVFDYRAMNAQGRIGTAALPDDGLAVAGWFNSRAEGMALRLMRCDTGGCGTDSDSDPAVLERQPKGLAVSDKTATAVAVTRDGILVASAFPEKLDDKGLAGLQVRLIRCADLRCASPASVVVTRYHDDLIVAGRAIAVAADRAGRPVVAFLDNRNVAHVITCADSADSACDRPHDSRRSLLAKGATDNDDFYRGLNGIDLVVPPDGRPVLTYREPGTGAAWLVRCETFECPAAEAHALTGPTADRRAPNLALDGSGLPMVATYDQGRAVLLVCRDAGCRDRRRVVLGKPEGGPGPMDLAVRRDGRPVLLWRDDAVDKWGDDGRSNVHLTVCARPRCGA